MNSAGETDGLDGTMGRMQITMAFEALWQAHARWDSEVARRAGQGSMLPLANSSARAATAEDA